MAAKLAAVSEAATPTRRSKRRAASTEESSVERAEKIKAVRNLDANPCEGNTASSNGSFLQFTDKLIVDNMSSVGILLGKDTTRVNSSVKNLREQEEYRLNNVPVIDRISEVFDKEEKEREQEEEVDKLILNSLCKEIMEEVMDMDSAYPQDCDAIPTKKLSSSSKKKKRNNKNSKPNIITQ